MSIKDTGRRAMDRVTDAVRSLDDKVDDVLEATLGDDALLDDDGDTGEGDGATAPGDVDEADATAATTDEADADAGHAEAGDPDAVHGEHDAADDPDAARAERASQ